MIKIECLGTGSKGNHFRIINSKGEILLVELGIPINDILRDLDIDKVCGAVVSHNHKDHNFNDNVKRFSSFGIPILTTLNGIVGKKVQYGNYSIIPLPCKHNVKCYGYLINTDNTTILFATDTKDLPKVNIHVDIFMIEVNYIEEMVNKVLNAMDYNDQKLSYESRCLITHNSLERTELYFHNLNYKPSAILIIHKSDNPNHYEDKRVVDTLKNCADYIESFDNGKSFEIE